MEKGYVFVLPLRASREKDCFFLFCFLYLSLDDSLMMAPFFAAKLPNKVFT